MNFLLLKSPGIDNLMMSDEYHELSSELITLNRKKYKLEEKVSVKFAFNWQKKDFLFCQRQTL